MDESVIEVDYLIKGAGAVGRAFADSILTHSNATMVMVDRHDRPGGHWNDAYSFVRLHQPSSLYGTISVQLGSGVKDSAGLNAGFYELASGHEVVSHFDSVMQDRLVPSGRVHYFPMSELGDDRIIRSRVSGRRVEVRATTLVDATHSKMNIPSTSHRPIGLRQVLRVWPPTICHGWRIGTGGTWASAGARPEWTPASGCSVMAWNPITSAGSCPAIPGC